MPQPSEADIAEEQRHFANVITTFQQYASYALAANNRRRKDLYALPHEDQRLLEEIGWKEKRLVEIDEAILENAKFLKEIIAQPEIFSDVDVDVDGAEDLGEGGGEGFEDGEGHGGGNERERQGGRGQSHGHSHSHSHLDGRGHTHAHDHSHPHSHTNPGGTNSKNGRYRPTDFDMDKLRSTLKQFVRDWSEEGRSEREASYGPMKDALLRHFANVTEAERSKLRILVPGAGLGRLAYDVARLGFSCQGNEYSHYMLLASYFILNRTSQINQHTIYPYVHSLSNIPNREALLRPITIPDVLPSDIPRGVNFSLVAGILFSLFHSLGVLVHLSLSFSSLSFSSLSLGDFEEVYGADEHEDGEPQAGQWDAILTCFFIDTAKNIINYLRIIHKILAPGGVWINLGPLLWHWENNTTNDISVELDLEEVKSLCRKIGFRLDNERTIETTYTNNSQSMLGYVYKTAFWTATKN